ncbi:MAG: amidohydrolase family protein [Pseudomonadota bacterium]
MKIDAHQHFWALERGDYGWLTPDLDPIYRDFGPGDLAPHLKAAGIGGSVLVQAAPTDAETDYMLSLAAAHDTIKGVVGWVDFERADAPARIAELARHEKLVGLRPMIQDIPDPDWMISADLTPAFRAMVRHGLVFDALTLPKHLKNLATLLAQHPDLACVIDHGSKPDIAAGTFHDWAADMTYLAGATQARVKLSGLVTEAGPDWTVETLRPFTDHIIAHFGAARVIWGSDWPVAMLASDYARWWDTTGDLLAGLPQTDRAAILGRNAIEFYGLETPL